jgi:hypothetical protein
LIACTCAESGADRVPDDDRMPWTGLWPGVAECQEYGLYAKLIEGKGWVPCSKDDPDAMEDLNALRVVAEWDRQQKRFVKKQGGEPRT